MKITVTVKLEDGVESTKTVELQTSLILLLLKESEFNASHASPFGNFGMKLNKEVAAAAAKAMQEIQVFIANNNLILQKENEIHLVKCIEEAKSFKSVK